MRSNIPSGKKPEVYYNYYYTMDMFPNVFRLQPPFS